MKEDNQKWHLDVLAMHQNIMFETLIYPFHLITDTSKEFTLLDHNNQEYTARGYLAVKEVNNKKIKYFIQEDFIDSLPIRVDNVAEVFLQDAHKVKSIVYVVQEPTPFKIKAENVYADIHSFIDNIAPFQHTNPEQWTLNKMIAVAAYIGKTFIGISSEPEFGKSSIYEVIHSITKKSPVFQPRSIPGIMAQITNDGNMVFDEVQKSSAEVKMCMENFTQQVAAGKPNYVNGAMQSAHTKPMYDVSGQSITYLYNLKSNYKNPEEEFFDYIFSNNDAMDSRILKVKFTGKLTEQFDKEFSMRDVATQNRMFYVKVAKQLLYLKELKLSGGYKRRYVTCNGIILNGRKKNVYDEITWLIDLYCVNQAEYDKFIDVLNSCITDYQKMIGKSVSYFSQQQINVVLPSKTTETVTPFEKIEESVLEWDNKCVVWLPCKQCADTPCNFNLHNIPLCKKHLR